jgi:hypothetical protein
MKGKLKLERPHVPSGSAHVVGAATPSETPDGLEARRDPDPRVRAEAASAPGLVGVDAALAALIDAADIPDSEPTAPRRCCVLRSRCYGGLVPRATVKQARRPLTPRGGQRREVAEGSASAVKRVRRWRANTLAFPTVDTSAVP